MRTKILKVMSFAAVVIVVLSFSIALQLELPAPSGIYAVGQAVFKWQDTSCPETLTESADDFREVIGVIWYPAMQGTGTQSPYFPALSTVSNGLVESGEVEGWQAFGLQYVRSHNLLDAEGDKSDAPYPIVVLSPGNGTNIEFYTSLASEIASHGYIVIGVNHPYDVAAVELSTGFVAPYDKAQWSLDVNAHQVYTAERIKVRTADVLFALNQLENLNTDSLFAGMLDMDSIAVAGHSLGGITASEACKADARFRACINFDGSQRGGPFSMDETATPPQQPFMFLTKESQLHPKLIERFESTFQSYWVIVHNASHESFTDGPLLQPSLLPIPNQADRIIELIQEYTLAFLDATLKGKPADLLSETLHRQDISVKAYPSH